MIGDYQTVRVVQITAGSIGKYRVFTGCIQNVFIPGQYPEFETVLCSMIHRRVITQVLVDRIWVIVHFLAERVIINHIVCAHDRYSCLSKDVNRKLFRNYPAVAIYGLRRHWP